MTRLEQAQGKLQRLKRESEEMHHLIRAEHDRIPFGQPNIIGRGDIYKKVNGYHDRAIKLLKEQEKQEKRVEMLEKVEDFKEKNELIKDVHVVGKSSYATVGAKTSVNNIDYFDAVVIAGGKSVQREDGFFIVVTDGFQRSHFPGEGFFRGHVRSYLEIAAGILSVRDEINLRNPCFSVIDLAAAAQ